MGILPAPLLIGPAISIGAALTSENYQFSDNLTAFILGMLIFAFGIYLSAAAALGPDGVTALSLDAEKQTGLAVPKGTFIATEYWHGDGDFWQPGRNYLFKNLLNLREVNCR